MQRAYSGPPQLALLERHLTSALFRLDMVKSRSSSSFDYQFRCPFCGDSKKSAFKARGFLYERKGNVYFKCFNCGEATTGLAFLKRIDPQAFERFKLDQLKGASTVKIASTVDEPEPEPEPVARRSLAGLVPIDELEDGHPAKEYVRARQIPKARWGDVYYTDAFYAYVNSHLPGKITSTDDEPRIVLPFLDEDGHLFGCNARVIDTKSRAPRYMTILFDDKATRCYGRHHVDKTKEIVIVEGPIDSLFLDNAMAMAGADVPQGLDKTLSILAFDNEPRNAQIVERMHKYLTQGYRVLVWPKELAGKDLNDLVLNGFAPSKLEALIRDNAFSGLRGMAALASWRRS